MSSSGAVSRISLGKSITKLWILYHAVPRFLRKFSCPDKRDECVDQNVDSQAAPSVSSNGEPQDINPRHVEHASGASDWRQSVIAFLVTCGYILVELRWIICSQCAVGFAFQRRPALDETTLILRAASFSGSFALNWESSFTRTQWFYDPWRAVESRKGVSIFDDSPDHFSAGTIERTKSFPYSVNFLTKLITNICWIEYSTVAYFQFPLQHSLCNINENIFQNNIQYKRLHKFGHLKDL